MGSAANLRDLEQFTPGYSHITWPVTQAYILLSAGTG